MGIKCPNSTSGNGICALGSGISKKNGLGNGIGNLPLLDSLLREETGTGTQTRHISRWRPAGNSNCGNDQNKSLVMNYIQRIVKFELLMWTQVKESSYLRLILLDSGGSL